MGQLTSREIILMAVVIVLGLAFFAAVCVTIYYIFKRLARLDNEALEKDGLNNEASPPRDKP